MNKTKEQVPLYNIYLLYIFYL